MLHILSCEPLLRILGHFFVKQGWGRLFGSQVLSSSIWVLYLPLACFPLSNTPPSPTLHAHVPKPSPLLLLSVDVGGMNWPKGWERLKFLHVFASYWSGACLPSLLLCLLLWRRLTWSADELPHFMGQVLVVISRHWVRNSGCGVQGCVCHLPSRWLCWSLTFEGNCSRHGGSAGWVHFLRGTGSCSACVTLQETPFLNEHGPTLWGIDTFPHWVCDSGNQRALLVPAGCHGNLLCKLSLEGKWDQSC